MAIPNEKGRYSYVDYQRWEEDKRVELIDGEIFVMIPTPSRKHQQVLREISTAFSIFLRDKNCEVFFAPFDVRLLTENKQEENITDVVQPDLAVVCEQGKLDEKDVMARQI